jgi:hypothetical protein
MDNDMTQPLNVPQIPSEGLSEEPPKEHIPYKNPRPNPGQFKKGDPRINRNGRPKSFDTLRRLAQDKLISRATDKDGNPIVINGKPATVIEVLLQQMIESKNPNERKFLLEIAYGKVPDELQVTGKDGKTFKIDVALTGDYSDEDK